MSIKKFVHIEYAPVVLFTYNRPWHTRLVLDSLAKNAEAKDSILYIYCDGAKEGANVETLRKISEVRKIARKENRFKEVVVVEQTKNKGLANSVIDGVTEIVNKYGTVIVLEDDLISSPYLLRYMNEALDLYENDDKVISIHGYVYPTKQKLPETFFMLGADCWGWATWKRGWDLFEADGKKLLKELETKNLTKEFDFSESYPFTQMLRDQIVGKNNSWAIRWYASAFLAGKLTLYPGKTLVQNIGNDGSGTHSGVTNVFGDKRYPEGKITIRAIPIEENKMAKLEFERFFKTLKASLLSKILDKIVRMKSITKLNIKKGIHRR